MQWQLVGRGGAMTKISISIPLPHVIPSDALCTSVALGMSQEDQEANPALNTGAESKVRSMTLETVPPQPIRHVKAHNMIYCTERGCRL